MSTAGSTILRCSFGGGCIVALMTPLPASTAVGMAGKGRGEYIMVMMVVMVVDCDHVVSSVSGLYEGRYAGFVM